MNLLKRIDEKIKTKMEISQGDMIKHYEQIVRDVTSNVNNLRSDMMMRM